MEHTRLIIGFLSGVCLSALHPSVHAQGQKAIRDQTANPETNYPPAPGESIPAPEEVPARMPQEVLGPTGGASPPATAGSGADGPSTDQTSEVGSVTPSQPNPAATSR